MRARFGAALILTVAAAAPGLAGDTTFNLGGHVKPQLIVTGYPDDSLFRDVFGSSSEDVNLDARIVLGIDHERWSFDVDYQFIVVHGDQVEFSRELPPELRLLYPHLPTDRMRLFNLTHVFTDSGKTAVLNRLDRLAVSYTSDKVVMKFGRQAISWGNGFIYTAMDIFNPFDPAAVDKEFKTGDDMLYGQYLRWNGDDLQGVMVFRRDLLTGDVEADVSSLAFKYHGMVGGGEYDTLVARHYGDTLIGAGGNHGLGGAVWNGDLVVTFTDEDTVPSLVTNLTYSWMWGGKNVSGVVEYFYNGFGQADGCYTAECLEDNPELLSRLARGELFTLGRNYLAVSAMFELHPLFLLTPNVFVNIGDPSAFLQVVFQNDLKQNLVLLSSVNLPIGAGGTEFGGLPTEIPGLYLSTGPSIFVQLAWYW
ncbi:MAG: hypothetical protein IFK91_00285 [Acidobacteria bacterium]|nr:hypothetical protein [Candidatus Sulfomarinibacter sp. MAG AM1]